MSREAGSDYAFVETDAGAIVSGLIEAYEKITGRTVQPASVDRLFISWVADVITQICVQINYAGNQNIPSRAEGENLDALAELFFDTSRPEAKAATVTMRFDISEAQSTAVLVPAGTRVKSADGSVAFATVADAYVPIGATSVDVTAVCDTAGATGNGYAIGQINTIVDLYPYHESCANIDESDGGADEASDDELYDRMRASEDAYSDAGSAGGYVYFARSVSTEIADVKAVQPTERVARTLAVHSGHAFLGGEGLKTDGLRVCAHGSAAAAALGTDYAVTYDDGLLTIGVVAGGALDGATQLDVEIERVKAGHVYIYVLMSDGTIASQTIKNLVLEACNPDHVRPLTDRVSVEDPRQVGYDIAFTYYVPTAATKSAAEIQAAVEAAVDEYKAWQSARLGRDINPSKLISLLMQTGIKRVELTAPTFTALADGSSNSVPDIAIIGTVSITNGGYEDE